MRPIIFATILVATAVSSKGTLLNDNAVIEAYNANNLYKLDYLKPPAYVEKPNETSNFKKSFDWAI